MQIDMIAPDHGVIWRSNPGMAINSYAKWCNNQGDGNALIIYDTMWHSTETMAKAIATGLQDEGISYKLLNLRHNHRSDVMREVLNASALILTSDWIAKVAALLDLVRRIEFALADHTDVQKIANDIRSQTPA